MDKYPEELDASVVVVTKSEKNFLSCFEYCLVCLSILSKVKTSKGLPTPFVKAKSKTDIIIESSYTI